MGILSWIIFGLIAGIIAKWIMPGKENVGIIVTIILGIVGAVVGGYISTFFGFGKVDGFNFGSFVVAVIGAIVVLYIFKKVKSYIKGHRLCPS
ncbi:putative transglycosylase associated protein [Escherichia coli]|uniref:GlsB/YeaQ/YmgE family stress response membrane protein n=2 Tax=Escherichia coli TaxID=562 RepID=UPI0006A3F963|nr:GlsB/YeaQ/YmgE family stress response membrane protein [Escherichia coli]CUA04088.1 putative transglycosylase associated protein [Escherichia coli]HBD3933547.1 GlsB/YeaQ/YmgE family stress response membrane protein [Escherichia coli]